MAHHFSNALRRFSYAGVVGALMVSCSERYEEDTNQHTTIHTRAIELPVSVTRMGVSLLNNGQAEDPFSFHNLLFNRVTGEEWQYNGTPTIAFEREQSLVTVVAYAPYQELVNYPLMTARILPNQQTTDALAQSDMVYTYHPNMMAGNSIDLRLTHQFTNLRLKLAKGSEYVSATDFKIENVRFMQLPTTATFNLKDSTLTNLGEVDNILPFRNASYPVVGPLAEFQAIVLPQQIAAGKTLFEIDFLANGEHKTTKVTVAQKLNLPSGTWLEFEVKVGSDLTVELTDANITVEDWLYGGVLFRESIASIPTLDASQLTSSLTNEAAIDLRENYYMLRVTGTMDDKSWTGLQKFTNLEYLQLPAGSQCPTAIVLNTSYAYYMAPHVANITNLRLLDNVVGDDRWSGINRMMCAIKTPVIVSFEDKKRSAPFTIVPSYSFKDCSQLEIFQSFIDIVGRQTFMNCTKLSALYCGSIHSVQSQAFWGCSACKNMMFNFALPMEELGEGAFGNMPVLSVLKFNNSLINLSKSHFGGTTNTSLIDLTVTHDRGISGNTINGIPFKSIKIAAKW